MSNTTSTESNRTNGFAVVRVGNGTHTHIAADIDFESGSARCGAESRVNRGLGGRRGLTELALIPSMDTVSCSKCQGLLEEYGLLHGAMARQAEAEEEAASELAEHNANAELEARDIETAHRSRHGAGVYRVAHWGGDVYRVERQHTGRDGRTLSIGDYSAGAEHYGREELTKDEAESLVVALNNAVATVDGNALELALRRTTVDHARRDMADELAQQRAYDLGHHKALEDCECNGLEALCEDCGGRGRRPYRSTINALETERRNLDGYAADVELAKDTVLEALGRLEQATRRWTRADNRLTNLDDAINNARLELEERS